MRTVCTRFAPSPTGFLHLGGARTALFSWLFARRHEGRFVLRIEDTDVGRAVADSADDIAAALQWLGLDWDVGPVYQSQRLDRYTEAVEQLLAADKAYYCYCTGDELAERRAEQIKNRQKPRYDGFCRNRLKPRPGVQPAVRFRNPELGCVTFQDQVYGAITVNNLELDDLVIRRANGMPTYNFCVVIDDADLGISHVVRGDDHINNTPRQINIFEALDLPVPVYAHVPTVFDENGKPLSKRTGACSVTDYRAEGYLPQALLNYLVRMGWSAGDREIFSLVEMSECFDFSSVSRAPPRLNKKKLNSLNRHYLCSSMPGKIVDEFISQVHALDMVARPGKDLEKIIYYMARRCATLREMAEKSRYFFVDELSYEDLNVDLLSLREATPWFAKIEDMLSSVTVWDSEAVAQALKNFCAENRVTMKEIGPPLRTALTGGFASPGLKDVIVLLGKKRCLLRLKMVQKKVREAELTSLHVQ